MEEIKSNLNKHIFTAYTLGAETKSIIFRATKEGVVEADANNHLKIILKNVFTGTSETKILPTGGGLLHDTRPFWSEPFCLLKPSDPWECIKPVEMVNFLPEGWNYDDPCIATKDTVDSRTSSSDYIINLRTKEVIYLRQDFAPITVIRSMSCPHVSGEALPIFSLFMIKLDTFGCMTACRAPVPGGMPWYEKLGERREESSTSFFSEKSSTSFFSEESSSDDSELSLLTAYIPDSAYMRIPVDTSTFLVDELAIGAYMHHKLKDNVEPLIYNIEDTEESISYMDKIHKRFGYFRVGNDPSAVTALHWTKVTYKRQNLFIPTGDGIDPMELLNT